RPRGKVDVELLQLAEIDDDAAVRRGMARAAVAAAPDGDLEAELTGGRDRRRDVGRVGGPDDRRGMQVVLGGEGGPDAVVLGIVGTHDVTADAAAKNVDGGGGGCLDAHLVTSTSGRARGPGIRWC